MPSMLRDDDEFPIPFTWALWIVLLIAVLGGGYILVCKYLGPDHEKGRICLHVYNGSPFGADSARKSR